MSGRMDLLKHIRHQRAKQKQKKPSRRNVFNQISNIVRQCGLKESFLDIFDNFENHLAAKTSDISRIRMKTPLISPLFSLVDEEAYRLTMSIINKVDNPYLVFAHSPEEILLCKPLYHLNPELSPEKLNRYHFETLLSHERIKQNRMKTNLSNSTP